MLAFSSFSTAHAAAGLVAEYYNDTEPFGVPVLERIDAGLAFDWGNGSPHASLPNDGFSARWTGFLTAPVTGPVTLTVFNDDGVRLWLGERLIIDSWVPQSARSPHRVTVAMTAGQQLPLQLEYFEQSGAASIELCWSYAGQPDVMVPATALTADSTASFYDNGTGLQGHYYDNKTITGAAVLQRQDAQIDFSWGREAPDPALPADSFSVQWLGDVLPRFTGSHRFTARTDDGVRVFLDGQLIIDSWRAKSARDIVSSPVHLIAGRRYSLRVDYFEQSGGARAQLRWQGPHEPDRPIPQSQLFPPRNLSATIAPESMTNPAFIEGWRGTDLNVQIALSGARSQLPVLELGAQAWSADVPLQTTGATGLTLTAGGESLSAAVTWVATPLDGETSLIRVGDALRFQVPDGGELMVRSDSGFASQGLHADPTSGLVDFHFTSAGYFDVEVFDAAGTSAGTRRVDVVAVSYERGLACEIGWERQALLPVEPFTDSVVFGAGDPLRLAVRSLGQDPASEKMDVRLQPHERREPILTARLGSARGPICWHRKVETFRLESDALLHALAFGNTGRAKSRMVMVPFRHDVDFFFDMFAHRATFAGGITKLTVNTDDVDPATGQALFQQSVDPVSGETIGTYIVDMETNGANRYCYRMTGLQVTNPSVQITVRRWFNGDLCKVTVGGGEFYIEETTNERPGNLHQVGTGSNRRTEQQRQHWIHKLRQHAIDEDGNASSYRLVLFPNVCQTGALDDAIGGSPRRSTGICPVPADQQGPCASEIMVFGDGCGLIWPPNRCEPCNEQCFLNPLHTGVRYGCYGLLLVGCNISDIDIDTCLFNVIRAEIDGCTGDDDTSERDPFPDVAVCIGPHPNSTPQRPAMASFGKAIQVTVRGEPGTVARLRLTTDHRRLAVSADPVIRLPADIDLGDERMVDEHFSFCENFNVTIGSDCVVRHKMYLHALAPGADVNDLTNVELHGQETRSVCENDTVVDKRDSTTWVLADTEPSLTVSAELVELRPEVRRNMAAAQEARIVYNNSGWQATRARVYALGRIRPALPAAQAQALFGNHDDACYPLTFEFAATDDSHADANRIHERRVRVETTWSDPVGRGRTEDHRRGEIDFTSAAAYSPGAGALFGQQVPAGSFAVWAEYRRMPENNDGFGFKWLRMMKTAHEVACLDFCLFYPRYRTNHQRHPQDPGRGQGDLLARNWDNWFYYWSQNRRGQLRSVRGKQAGNVAATGVCQHVYGFQGAVNNRRRLFVCEGNMGNEFGSYVPNARVVRIARRAAQQTQGFNAGVRLGNNAAMIRNETDVANANNRGRATVAWAVNNEWDLVNISYAHEVTHDRCRIASQGRNADRDGDIVPDSWESPLKMLTWGNQNLVSADVDLRNSFTTFTGSNGGDYEYYAWVGASFVFGSYNWQNNAAARQVAIAGGTYRGLLPVTANPTEDWSVDGFRWNRKDAAAQDVPPPNPDDPGDDAEGEGE